MPRNDARLEILVLAIAISALFTVCLTVIGVFVLHVYSFEHTLIRCIDFLTPTIDHPDDFTSFL